MQVKLRVRRYDPQAEAPPSYQSYQVDAPEYATVLDALIQVREEVDQTLALRCSCRSAICGSCAMRINHRARLACKTKVITLAPDGQEIVVEPAGNMPVIKDLVADMQPFWDKVRAVQPWLQPTGPEPEREYIVPDEAMIHLAGVMNCIMCGACVSDCTSLAVDPNFLGPAALAKAYRFVGDPRDGQDPERLRTLSEYTGIWDCTHCFICVEVCPKDVAPMERIMALRKQATEAGFTNNPGSRHHEAIADSVRHSGRLDETMVTLRSIGFLNLKGMLEMAGVGLRAFLKGKMPPPGPLHRPIPGARNVERIFRNLEEKK